MSESSGETLKEKYLNFLDTLKEKGVPAPNVLVPLVIIIVIAAAIFLALPMFAPTPTQSITVFVKDAKQQPIQNAAITLTYAKDGKTFFEGFTGTSGKAIVDTVPVDGSIEAKAVAAGFKSSSAVLVDGDISIILQEDAVAPTKKTFSVLVSSSLGGALDSAIVTISFDDGNVLSDITDATGRVTFSMDTLPGHATIRVEKPGFQAIEQSVGADAFATGTVNFATEPESQATPSPEVETSGALRISVSSKGVPIADAKVTLTGLSGDVITTAKTDSSGVAPFFDFAIGTRFVVRVEKSGFATKEYPASLDYITFTTDGQTEKISLETKQAASTSMINFEVVDKEGLPVAAAEINFFYKSSNKNAKMVFADDAGMAKFEAAKGVVFYATVYRTGFLPTLVESVQAGEEKKVVLNEEVAGSTATLSITVGADFKPASGARIGLYRENGMFLGIPILDADESGQAVVSVPTQFNANNYGLYAKADYGAASGQSDVITITSQTTEAQLNLSLFSPKAKLLLKVRDLATGKPVPSATAQILVANNPLDVCTTTADGVCEFPIAANQEFTFAVTASGYLSFSSSALSMASASEENKTVELYPLSSGLKLQFNGLYNSQGQIKEVSNGERYTAKFIVNVPFGAEQAGVYLRVGDSATAAEETAAITDYDKTSSAGIYSGTTFDPALQCPTDTTPQTGEGLKWVLLQFPRGFTGSKELTYTITTRKDVTAEQAVSFAYRAFAIKNNTIFFSPNDASLATEMLAKGVTTTNNSLPLNDLCRAQTSSSTVPVSTHPLVCSEDGAICYKFYFESEGRKGGDGFQATFGKDVKLNYEVLSDYPIDSLSLASDHLKLVSYTSPSTKLADSEDDQLLSGQTVPVGSKAGVKAIASATLKAMKTTSSGLLGINFKSASSDAVFPEVQLAYSITGNNNFKVSVTPQSLKVAEQRKLSVRVQDKLSQPVTDATVELTECDGTPFSGNEQGAVIGEGTTGAGEEGKYDFKVKPSSIGVIGVRVSKEEVRTFEECLVPVSAQNFLSVTPEALEFVGESSKAEKQQLKLSSLVPETVRGSAEVDCFGEEKPVKVFPKTFTLKADGETTLTVQAIENVSSKAQCVVHITGRINNEVTSEVEVPIDAQLTCTNCVNYDDSVTGVASLPKSITLTVDPLYKSDSKTIEVSLDSDPIGCEVKGFRIDPYSLAQQGAGACYPGSASGLYGCMSCQTGAGVGAFNCFSCLANTQQQFLCQQCSAGQYQSGSFYCTGCTTYGAGLGIGAWYQGAGAGGQWGVGATAQLPLAGAQAGFGVGGAFATPFSQGCGSQLGALQYPYANQFPTSLSQLDAAAYEDSVTAECTKDEIIVTADYRGRQVVPGTGSLVVSLGGGQKRTIPITVLAGQSAIPTGQWGMFPGVPAGVSPWYQTNYYCSVDVAYEESQKFVLTGQGFKFSRSFQYSCPFNFPLAKATFRAATDNSGACKAEGKASGNGGTLDITCNFDASLETTLPEGETTGYIDIDLTSPQNPNARLTTSISITLVKKADDAGKPKLSLRPTNSAQYLCNIETPDSPMGEVMPEQYVQFTYQYPKGSTEKSMALLDAMGKPFVAFKPPLVLNLGDGLKSLSFPIPKNMTAGAYTWKMIYKVGNKLEEKLCSFIVGSPAVIAEPIEPRGPTDPVPSPRRSIEREVPETNGNSEFCDTPSTHPIRNIVVYNIDKDGAIVRTSEPANHFSSASSKAQVKLCVRSDKVVSPLENIPIKVKFVSNSVKKLTSVTSLVDSIAFNCVNQTIDGKQYYVCLSEKRPAKDFVGADVPSSGGKFHAVVDVTPLIDAFPTDFGTPTAGKVPDFKKRFYCQAWPMDRRAKSTKDTFGLGTGTESDSQVYSVLTGNGGVMPTYACEDPSAVTFNIGGLTGPVSGTSVGSRGRAGGSSAGGAVTGTRYTDPVLGGYGFEMPGLVRSTDAAGTAPEEKISFASASDEISFAPTPARAIYQMQTGGYFQFDFSGFIIDSLKLEFYNATNPFLVSGLISDRTWPAFTAATKIVKITPEMLPEKKEVQVRLVFTTPTGVYYRWITSTGLINGTEAEKPKALMVYAYHGVPEGATDPSKPWPMMATVRLLAHSSEQAGLFHSIDSDTCWQQDCVVNVPFELTSDSERESTCSATNSILTTSQFDYLGYKVVSGRVVGLSGAQVGDAIAPKTSLGGKNKDQSDKIKKCDQDPEIDFDDGSSPSTGAQLMGLQTPLKLWSQEFNSTRPDGTKERRLYEVSCYISKYSFAKVSGDYQNTVEFKCTTVWRKN